MPIDIIEAPKLAAVASVHLPNVTDLEFEASLTELAADSAALVVSLGYDTVEGDPHGTWHFGPEVFAGIGRLLAATELPVCVVQEGGYSLEALAPCSHAFAAGLLGEDPV